MPNDMPSPTTNPSTPPNRNMTYCRSCGAQIAKKAKICLHCGAKNSKPIYKKWWFWLIVVIILIGAFGSNGSNKSDTSSVQPSSSAQPPASSAPESPSAPENPSSSESSSEPESSSSSGSASNVFGPGITLETGSFKITYQECDADWRGYSEYLGPQNGNKVVRAFFIFENISNSDKTCGGFDFSCYADGVSCSQFIWSSEDSLSTTSLSPGRKNQGYVAFEVPISAEEIELEYEDTFNLFSKQKLIFTIE